MQLIKTKYIFNCHCQSRTSSGTLPWIYTQSCMNYLRWFFLIIPPIHCWLRSIFEQFLYIHHLPFSHFHQHIQIHIQINHFKTFFHDQQRTYLWGLLQDSGIPCICRTDCWPNNAEKATIALTTTEIYISMV